MSTIELKSSLQNFIAETDDLTILNQIKLFFKQLKEQSEDLELTAYEEKMVKIAEEQAKNGQLIPDKVVRASIDKWINEKRQ